ncbi:MAG: RluA family pseudouridine synthase [Clostridia bacterium]|nr:RluA family pseudouridine synthase [Clostridia bacterium]
MKELFYYPKIEDKGIRIDVYLSKELSETRSRIKTLIASGKVFLNGEQVSKSGAEIKQGEIKVLFEAPRELDALPQDIPLEVVFQDKDIAVINKPQGMVTHPAAGSPDNTLVNAALFHIKDLSGINGVFRPGIVHRLDKDTSGLLVIAKNNTAHLSLARQIADKTAERYYIALVEGNIKQDSGTIDMPLARLKTDRKKMSVDENGRRAVTGFKVIERFGDYTLVEFKLQTGRTHQIRVHCKALNHAVVGDITYGRKDKFGLKGQLLHSYKLALTHPSTGERLVFEAPLPEYFERVLAKLRP